MIISFSGDLGSGKSTVAKALAEKLNWPRYYIGGIRRQKAKEKGLTLSEYNELGEKDSSTDIEVDDYLKKLGQEKDDFIAEGRTAWYFIPHSLKIYIKVNEQEGARRIFNDLQKNNQRNEGNGLKTLEDVLENNRQRLESDKKRYLKYYDIDVYDESNYDYVLDTSNLTIEEVFNEVFGYVNEKLLDLKNS